MTGGRRRIAVVGVLVPLLAAVVLVWSTTGREQNLDRVAVAVVNEDTVITGPQPMAAGRALAATLTQPTSTGPDLDWTLADSADAQKGLRAGDYYAVLTIPSDFSAAILSTGTDTPTRGRLQLTSNGAASTTVPAISEAVASAAAASLGQQSTRGYLDQVYSGFNQIASSNRKTATSATSLADGADQLAAGADSLDGGIDALADSLTQLAAGAAALATATGSVATGTRDVADGASGVATGSRELDRGARRLADSSATLARSAGEVSGAAGRLARGAAENAAGAREVARANRELARRIAEIARLCDRIVRGDRFCSRIDAARDTTRRLAAGSTEVGIGSSALAEGSRKLAGATSALAGGARRLAGGADTLAGSGAGLTRAAEQLAGGAGSVARGAAEVDRSAGSLASGAEAAEQGAAELVSGSAGLVSSAVEVSQGADQLGQGLTQEADQSPTYSSSQEKALEKVVSEPVVLASTVQHTEHGNGWLLALVLGLVLWLAALVAVMGRDLAGALAGAEAPVSSGRLAAAQLGPAAVVALLQAAAVVAVLPLLQLSTASPASLVLLTLVAAVVFTALGVLLRWAFGTLGLAVLTLLLVLQAAALGNVVPIETAPQLVQTLNALLPLTVYVDAASQLVSGGAVGSLGGAVTVLSLWGAVAVLAAVAVVRRGRLDHVERMTGIEPA